MYGAPSSRRPPARPRAFRSQSTPVTAILMAWSIHPSPRPPKGCGLSNGLSLCLWGPLCCRLRSSSCQAVWACWRTPFIILEMQRQPSLRHCIFFARKRPNKRFTFGYGRVEDLAGVTIVFTILFSALVAGYESIDRFFHPQDISHLWAVAVASGIGFLGNEAVAIFRIRVGRRIGSAALIADGHHARESTAGPVWRCLSVCSGCGLAIRSPIQLSD